MRPYDLLSCISTHIVVFNASVNPLALAFILCAATEYPKSSDSIPRTGDNLVIGKAMSSVFSESANPINIHEHSAQIL